MTFHLKKNPFNILKSKTHKGKGKVTPMHAMKAHRGVEI
jgi:hypothetical protein